MEWKWGGERKGRERERKKTNMRGEKEDESKVEGREKKLCWLKNMGENKEELKIIDLHLFRESIDM